jgi:uncharacterized protein
MDDDAHGGAVPPGLRPVAAAVEPELAGEPSGHGMAHARRVCDLAVRIARAEGADRETVGAAALVHDLHRVRGCPPRESLDAVRAVLEDAGFRGDVGAVCDCVAVHDDYEFRGADPPPTLEAAVLQDADNLDAIGAVGIARAFQYAGARERAMFDPGHEGPPEENPSTYGHVHEKLLRLRDELNTARARELAADRHAFVERFAERFRAEHYGE